MSDLIRAEDFMNAILDLVSDIESDLVLATQIRMLVQERQSVLQEMENLTEDMFGCAGGACTL